MNEAKKNLIVKAIKKIIKALETDATWNAISKDVFNFLDNMKNSSLEKKNAPTIAVAIIEQLKITTLSTKELVDVSNRARGGESLSKKAKVVHSHNNSEVLSVRSVFVQKSEKPRKEVIIETITSLVNDLNKEKSNPLFLLCGATTEMMAHKIGELTDHHTIDSYRPKTIGVACVFLAHEKTGQKVSFEKLHTLTGISQATIRKCLRVLKEIPGVADLK